MKKLSIVTLAAMAALNVSVAQANIGGFTGSWRNVNANTSGITKLIVRLAGSQVIIKTFGQCHPQDCSWGITKALPFTSSVSGNELRQTKALTAVYKKGYSDKLLVIKKIRGNKLVVQLFSQMKDSRSNYTRTYILKRN